MKKRLWKGALVWVRPHTRHETEFGGKSMFVRKQISRFVKQIYKQIYEPIAWAQPNPGHCSCKVENKLRFDDMAPGAKGYFPFRIPSSDHAFLQILSLS